MNGWKTSFLLGWLQNSQKQKRTSIARHGKHVPGYHNIFKMSKHRHPVGRWLPGRCELLVSERMVFILILPKVFGRWRLVMYHQIHWDLIRCPGSGYTLRTLLNWFVCLDSYPKNVGFIIHGIIMNYPTLLEWLNLVLTRCWTFFYVVLSSMLF